MIFVAGRSSATFSERTTKSAHAVGTRARQARSTRPPGSLPIVKVLRVIPCALVGPDGLVANVPGFGPGLTTLQLTNSLATGLSDWSVTRTSRERDSGRPGTPVIVAPVILAMFVALDTTIVYWPVAVTGNCV